MLESQMKLVKIYKLLHPDTKEIRYVGVTTGKLNQRLSQHIHSAKNRRGTVVSKWIWSLLKVNKKPIIQIIEECTLDIWEEKEKYYIKKYKNLCNTHPGGRGVVINRQTSSIERSAKAHRKKVFKMSLDGEILSTYDSISCAANQNNILNSEIGNVLSGRAITAGGFHWVLEKNYNSFYKIPKFKKVKHVMCKNTEGHVIQIFTSMTKANLFMGVSCTNPTIRRRIKDGKSYKNLFWFYR